MRLTRFRCFPRRPALVLALLLACGGGWAADTPAPVPAGSAAQAKPAAPQQAVDELLAADRSFGTAAAQLGLAEALGAMFAEDVVMPAPNIQFARGRAQALDALTAHPDNAGAKVRWAPARGGISADGLHGFTYGYMEQTKADGTVVPMKYLAYWIKREGSWQVAVYRRRPRAAGAIDSALVPAALPPRLVAPSSDEQTIAAHHASVEAVEQRFSDEAQVIGLGPAFEKYGSADAVNMGGPDAAGFVVGSVAIARAVSAGGPATGSPVSWKADESRVASSGDLGVTIGVLRPNAAGPDGKPQSPFPFFTIWRRAHADAPWLYVAE